MNRPEPHDLLSTTWKEVRQHKHTRGNIQPHVQHREASVQREDKEEKLGKEGAREMGQPVVLGEQQTGG